MLAWVVPIHRRLAGEFRDVAAVEPDIIELMVAQLEKCFCTGQARTFGADFLYEFSDHWTPNLKRYGHCGRCHLKWVPLAFG